MKFFEDTPLYHQAGTGNSTFVLGGDQAPQIAYCIAVIASKDVSCKSGDSNYHTGMLDRIVRVKKLSAYDAYIFSLALANHALKPLWGDHLCVIVQQKEIISIGISGTVVIDCGIVKRTIPFYHFYLRVTSL